MQAQHTVTLRGKDVYSQMRVDPTMRTSTKEGRDTDFEYHIARFRGLNFTVSPEFQKAWSGNKLSEVTLSSRTFEASAVDPESGEMNSVTRHSWEIDGWLTFDAEKAVAKGEAEIQAISLNLQELMARAQALRGNAAPEAPESVSEKADSQAADVNVPL